jgi:periplasmic mercuric ion binding protein
MRRFAFGMLVVSGLAFGCTPPAPAPVDPPKPAGGAAPTSGTTSAANVTSDVKLVSLKVPEMHCPHGCYPTVKKTLEGMPGVEGVDLAEQKSKDAIDNPVVKLKLNGSFDADAAMAALEKKGFKSEVVN